MAAIEHVAVAVNSVQTTTSSTYGDVTGAAIASSSFTVGKKYLITVTAQLSLSANSILGYCSVLHGTTMFAESELILSSTTANFWHVYQWRTVWTAVTSEGIKLQFKNGDNSTTLSCNFVSILAINLSDDLTENTDWFFAERANDDALSTTPLDGASITFTPGTAGHDWLVGTYAQVQPGATNTSSISNMSRSGEAASSVPSARLESFQSGTTIFSYPLTRVFSLGNASNTFKEQSATSSGVAHTRLHSSVFALNLNKFRVHSSAYTEADAALSATDYATELATLSITPAVAGDVWIGAYWGFDSQATGREAEFRLQEGANDIPAGQTTANYQFKWGGDNADETPLGIETVQRLTATEYTIALDASADSATSTPAGQHRQLWAVTMELPAAFQPSWGQHATQIVGGAF